MTILEALLQLRDDLKEWVTNNLRVKVNTDLENVETVVFAGRAVESGMALAELTNIEDDTFYEKSRAAGAHKAPALTEEQQSEIIALADSYFLNRKAADSSVCIKYTADISRNLYADAGCYNSSNQLKASCSTFAQLVWAGVDFLGTFAAASEVTDGQVVSGDSFALNVDTFDGTVSKAFDWGYYFDFPCRPAYGLAKTDSDGNITGYYGFVQPNEDSYEGSYSINTLYTGSDSLYGQSFRTYMYAADMANELALMGCEVTLKEAMPGDLVFLKGRKNNNSMELFEDLVYRGIDHVAMVRSVSDDGVIEFIECSPYFGTSIGKAAFGMTDNANKVRVAEIYDRIVMVARHPAAFGYGGNVPDAITAI